MKLSLKISVLLNVLLLVGLIFVWEQKLPASSSTSAVQKLESQTPGMGTDTQPTAARVEPAPWSWRELVSSDYRTYVKNLRAAGCPETTLRAIVAADVHKTYDAQYQELARQIAVLETNSWAEQLSSNGIEQSLKEKLQNLPGQEAAQIDDFLGVKGAPEIAAGTSANLGLSAPVARHPSLVQPITMPLIFQTVDPEKLSLNPDQVQAIARLRQQFWDEIGGPNQDPSDPAYRERWQKAQPEMDNMLRGMIGIEAFQNYQLEVMANSLGPTQAP